MLRRSWEACLPRSASNKRIVNTTSYLQSPSSARPTAGHRVLIAFFDYADVFEDFYPRYGVSQQSFATDWSATGNHAYISLLQRHVGEVIWYETSLAPRVPHTRHAVTGALIKFLPSSCLHRWMWKAFYMPHHAWRWRGAYRAFATVASYLALLSIPLWRTIWRDRPDVLFVQSYSSGRFDVLLLMSRLLRVPLVVYHAGGLPDGYLGSRIRKYTLPRADRIVVSSQREADMLLHRYRVSPEKLRLILTPMETEVFAPTERVSACRALGLDPERKYLLFVGRLEDGVKRVSAIIRSFASIAGKHAAIDLLIAGDGRDNERLRKLADELAPGRIRFVGWVSETLGKVQLYNCAECLIMASRREGFPTVIAEAMACGTPVLASDVGAISELVIDDETGWLFPPGDEQALQSRMSFLLEHPALLVSMRARVRKAALDRVSPEKVAWALKECFGFSERLA
jgi:glycosyltransferase involved in cell wall biosynthesis